MTSQEAIKAIQNNYPPERYTMLREALDLAIEALEKTVPCEHRNVTYWNHGYHSACKDCGEQLD